MSTAIACIYTNRKCICIEKDETHFSLGEKRVRNEYQYLEAQEKYDYTIQITVK